MKNIGFHTQTPLRFPRFTVVVVSFFVKILDDFHDFVSECVSFQMKINNPFWRVIVFLRKVTIFIGRETKIHIFRRKSAKQKSLRSVHLTIIILLEKYNHSTTTHNNHNHHNHHNNNTTATRTTTTIQSENESNHSTEDEQLYQVKRMIKRNRQHVFLDLLPNLKCARSSAYFAEPLVQMTTSQVALNCLINCPPSTIQRLS